MTVFRREGQLPAPRSVLIAALGLTLSAAAPDVEAAAPPRISRPKPAPATIPPKVPPLPPAVIDQSLSITGEELKARKIETRLTVPVQVNGKGPYNFIVDSGADTSVVGIRIARSLQLPLGETAFLNGMTSRDIVDRVKVSELTVGATTVRNLQLPALHETDLGGDGMIGIDALVEQRLLLDFERRTIKVEDARVPIRTLPGEIVVIARRHRGQLILTQVRAGGLPLDAVIDTGSQVTIGNLALRDRLSRKGRTKFVDIAVTGVTGVTINLQMATVPELRLGPVVLHNVPMAFADVPPFRLFGLGDEPAMLIGTDLLESFRRVSLDFRARKVRFQLRRCKEQGIIISTSPSTFTRLSSTGTPDVCGR